ncbi:hypothetical protein DH2020_037523 [Rehmannia glutinosa]|uniref:ACT domain-containing protein n=1 Tax=Rehmannia glutinosa TaxID=99300 RepID=A0ABR0V3Y1_REHGL
MDKICSLENAMIKQIENLDERVKTLEEQYLAAKQTIKSVVLVDDDNDESSDENDGESNDGQRLPEIEARIVNENILLKIQCEKRKGALVKMFLELDELNLDVISATVAPFGNLVLDITIFAQMEREFRLQVEDIVTALRATLQDAP